MTAFDYGTGICPVCGKEFQKRNSTQKYCCRKCLYFHQTEKKKRDEKFEWVLDMETWEWSEK